MKQTMFILIMMLIILDVVAFEEAKPPHHSWGLIPGGGFAELIIDGHK